MYILSSDSGRPNDPIQIYSDFKSILSLKMLVSDTALGFFFFKVYCCCIFKDLDLFKNSKRVHNIFFCLESDYLHILRILSGNLYDVIAFYKQLFIDV